jgi:hypothetical protein
MRAVSSPRPGNVLAKVASTPGSAFRRRNSSTRRSAKRASSARSYSAAFALGGASSRSIDTNALMNSSIAKPGSPAPNETNAPGQNTAAGSNATAKATCVTTSTVQVRPSCIREPRPGELLQARLDVPASCLERGKHTDDRATDHGECHERRR